MADFSLQKRLQPLSKVEPELAQHLAYLRRVAPDSAQYLAQRLFGDTMIPGVGNKLAFDDFVGRQRPGVHVMVDANDFGAINKQWGQSTGDDAIKAMGGALSRASRSNRGKLFRVGGDEFRAHFDTPEQAHSFARQAHKELEDLPPVKGQHHHSVSIGFGQDPDQAEQALIEAKRAKQQAGYAPGHALTHAHSLLPGAAGAVAVTPRQPEVPIAPRPHAPSPVQGPAFQRPIAKMEMPELAQARLRKAEAELLQKMALIHSGPGPMPIWRIENEKGEGPYTGRVGVSGYPYPKEPVVEGSGTLGSPEDIDQRRPVPSNDFTFDEHAMLGRGHNKNLKFGFMSPEHAQTWFGNEALNLFRQKGFVLRQVPAQKVWRSNSGRQVMFEPHEQPVPRP